jgi:uncharacterized membrane protein YjgN (DUF898 family)
MNHTNALDSLERMLAVEPKPGEEPVVSREFPFEFRGTGAEYFRIWIVNLLLTILTLGIFSAWAKVRRQRYFYGNTFLDGHSFEYHAKPLAILKGRLIVFAGYVAFFIGMQMYQPLLLGLVPVAAFGLPWILMRSRRFQLRMTSWRNVHFDFRGRYWPAVNAYVGWHIMVVAVFVVFALLQPMRWGFFFVALAVCAVLYPLWVHKRVEYSLDNAEYGREGFSFCTGSERFYLICGATAVLSVVALFAFGAGLAAVPGLIDETRGMQREELVDQLLEAGPKGWAVMVVAGLMAYAIAGFYRAKLLNASFGGVMVRLHSLNSRVGALGLMWINITNLLGILVTLGLYYPFARVRQVRYQLSRMSLEGSGQFHTIEAVEGADTSALGEEAGDFFNVDLGL